jgi:RNA polymerase primary sigma factor
MNPISDPPVHPKKSVRRLIRAYLPLRRELGREPTTEEIAAALSRGRKTAVTPKRVRQMIGDFRGWTKPSRFRKIAERSWVNPASGPTEPRERLAKQVKAVLDSLTNREQRVLQLRFGLKNGRTHTLEEIAGKLHLTPARIRLVEMKALRKLRREPRTRKPKDGSK